MILTKRARRGGPFAPVARRCLRKLVAATAVGTLGDGFTRLALPLLALTFTHSAFLIAAVLSTMQLPWLLVSLPGGLLVDRVDRRRLVLVTEAVRGLVVAGVALGTLTHHIALWELYVAAFLIGSGETLVSAATSSLLPEIAEGDGLVRANGHIVAARTTGESFAGPALGGVVYGLSHALPFLGDALSYFFSAGTLASAVTDARSSAPTALATEEAERPFTALRVGISYFFTSALLRTLAGTVASFAFCQAAVLGVLVIYATHVLHLSSTGYGIFLGIAAIGNVTGSLLARHVHGRLRTYATLLAAGGLAATGYLLLGSSSDRALAVAAVVLEALAVPVGNVATRAIRQHVIPRERFGVVSNAVRMFVIGCTPLGALAGGALAGAYGTRATFLAAGALQIIALALLARPLRVVRGTRQPQEAPAPQP